MTEPTALSAVEAEINKLLKEQLGQEGESKLPPLYVVTIPERSWMLPLSEEEATKAMLEFPCLTVVHVEPSGLMSKVRERVNEIWGGDETVSRVRDSSGIYNYYTVDSDLCDAEQQAERTHTVKMFDARSGSKTKGAILGLETKVFDKADKPVLKTTVSLADCFRLAKKHGALNVPAECKELHSVLYGIMQSRNDYNRDNSEDDFDIRHGNGGVLVEAVTPSERRNRRRHKLMVETRKLNAPKLNDSRNRFGALLRHLLPNKYQKKGILKWVDVPRPTDERMYRIYRYTGDFNKFRADPKYPELLKAVTDEDIALLSKGCKDFRKKVFKFIVAEKNRLWPKPKVTTSS